MIEAKALQRIRHAEVRAQKMIDECMRDGERKIKLAEKSSLNRLHTADEWARNRAEKIVEHAKKVELEEREGKITECKKVIRRLKCDSSSKKKAAIDYISNAVSGVGDA